MVVPVVGDQGQGAAAVGHADPGHVAFNGFRGRAVLVDDGGGTGGDGLADVGVAVGFGARDRDEQRSRHAPARVEGQQADLPLRAALPVEHFDALQKFI